MAFVQNLVYYVERAYRTPDFGMWERGSKYNDGTPEIHASSIGMAKSALEAINGCNLFGEKGASWSVVYVDIDAHNRNRSIFETMLPRESSSKVKVLSPMLTSANMSVCCLGSWCIVDTYALVSCIRFARGTSGRSVQEQCRQATAWQNGLQAIQPGRLSESTGGQEATVFRWLLYNERV